MVCHPSCTKTCLTNATAQPFLGLFGKMFNTQNTHLGWRRILHTDNLQYSTKCSPERGTSRAQQLGAAPWAVGTLIPITHQEPLTAGSPQQHPQSLQALETQSSLRALRNILRKLFSITQPRQAAFSPESSILGKKKKPRMKKPSCPPQLSHW